MGILGFLLVYILNESRQVIVNAIGAFVISMAGWWYLKNNKDFFVKEWIRKFIMKNPKMFRK